MVARQPEVVLIAGINGGIGSHVASRIREAGREALCMFSWLEQEGGLRHSGDSVGGVVNCAGKGMESSSQVSITDMREANVVVTHLCIRVAEKYDATLVHLGSAMEHDVLRTDTYVQTKRLASSLIRDARACSAGTFRSVRLSLHNVYGPRVKGVVADIAKQHWRGRPAVLRQPTATRDFVFASDVSHAVVKAIEVGDASEPIPIGSGVGTPISEIAELLSVHSRVKPPWTAATQKSAEAGPFSLVANLQLAASALSWQPQISLNEGLRLVSAYLDARGDEES